MVFLSAIKIPLPPPLPSLPRKNTRSLAVFFLKFLWPSSPIIIHRLASLTRGVSEDVILLCVVKRIVSCYSKRLLTSMYPSTQRLWKEKPVKWHYIRMKNQIIYHLQERELLSIFLHSFNFLPSFSPNFSLVLFSSSSFLSVGSTILRLTFDYFFSLSSFLS